MYGLSRCGLILSKSQIGFAYVSNLTFGTDAMRWLFLFGDCYQHAFFTAPPKRYPCNVSTDEVFSNLFLVNLSNE